MNQELYKFILVDDELIIRDALRDHVPWEELGFTFCGACADGGMALELIEQDAPDVVMTDICMPFIDGIALTEMIRERYPTTKVVLLTGYDDFEYAQAAVKLKVHDFLLKPITPKELRAVLLSVKEKLDEERKSRRDLESLKDQLNQSLPILRERVLNRLLSGLQEEDENRLGFLGLSFPLSGCSYLVMAVGIEGRAGGEEYELSLIAVKNEVERVISAGYSHVPFQDESGRLIILAWHERDEVIYRDSLFEAEEIGRVLFRYISLPVTVGIGEPVSAVQLIPRSYGEALRALSFGAIQGGGRVVTYRELVGGTSGPRKSPANWGRHIANALKVSSRGDVTKQIDDMVAAFRTGYFSPEEYYVTLQMTLAAILQAAEDFEIQRDEIFLKGTDPFAEVRAEASLEETREWFLSLCWRILDAFSGRQENFSRNKIREAQTYIENRYSDPSLSLRSVCKDLSISMSYFSLMFKKYLGKTFIEFLTEIRIEKAKELLRNTNMKTYEIARCIGYRDAHYFSLIFRKTAGEPPSVYRTGNRDETAKD